MSLIDVPISAPTITDVASNIRGKMGQVIVVAEQQLHQIRNLVRRHGRSTIAAELGSDAAAMLTVYTKLKEAIETAKQVTIEDLP